MQEQIKVQTFNWGPCVTKFKIKPEYAKQLLDEAKKNEEDFRGKLADGDKIAVVKFTNL